MPPPEPIRRYPFFTEGVCLDELVYAELWQWSHPRLTAPYWRFYWHTRPGARLQLDDQQIELTPEQIVLVPPHTPFDSTMDPIGPAGTPVGSLYAHFRLGMPYDRTPPDLLSFPAGAIVRRELELLCNERLEGRAAIVGREFLFIRILVDVLLSIPQNAWPIPVRDERLKRAISFMRNNMDRPLTLEEIAQVAGAGKSTLNRLFSREIGQSPYQHHLELRLRHACDLLHYRRSSIEQTAEACGFIDRTHFSKLFTRRYGQSPASYRISHREWRPPPDEGSTEPDLTPRKRKNT
ncbi:MAG: helix-turn-helix domain-containing protein [Verrucomicrobia bacterium]|jgi:AraC-like DNA-binding protein|nr:helix-turn-helix domain-containing protein [Verrucomicrobiota bacterium]